MIIDEYMDKLKDRWFIYEPALFMVLCSFPVEYSTKTKNIMTGPKGIKLNVDFFSDKSFGVFEDYMKFECVRILLEHPFKRVLPVLPIAYIASNILISENIKFENIKTTKADSLKTYYHKGDSYEDVYKRLLEQVKEILVGGNTENDGNVGSNGGSSSDDGGVRDSDEHNHSSQSGSAEDIEKALGSGSMIPFGDGDSSVNSSEWGQDELARALIGKIKAKAMSGNQWGSLPQDLVSIIMADDAPEYNYKTAIKRFRKNVISSDVELTRMKPNRRYGYEQMGKKRTYISNLLLVCDTSGSMTDNYIARFCGFVNKFFSYGIANIDTITYDTHVCDDTLRDIKTKVKFLKTESRGGTDISDILDYVNNRSKKHYSGVIVYTDGWFDFNKDKWKNEMKGVKYLFCIIDESGFEHFNKMKDDRIESSYIEL